MSDDPENCDRLSKRNDVLLDARCRKSSWNVVRVELGNISQGGCCIVGSGPDFAPGEIVELRIAHMKGISATVRWVRGQDAGVEFNTALKARAVDDLARIYSIVVTSAPAPLAPASVN